MESNQRTIEEVASDNIVEREVQPPKPPKRKKKMSFAVWWALHAAEELKTSTENMEQQDSSSVIENKSSAKALEKVDQKGDGQSLESEINENNQEPLKTCSEEHVPIDQKCSAGNIEKQNDSLISVEESIAGVQETVNIAEKQQPSKSEEQPPKRKRNKKKMIPFHIWLEKHAPTDEKTSAEHIETEDDSLVTEQESISVLEEKPEKEESSKTSTENVIHQDTSLPEEGDQEDSFKTKICKEELVISAREPVTENKSVTQKEVGQKGEKQSKSRRIKKTPLLWKSFPETDACIDLAFFCENSDINGLLSENQSHQTGLPSSEKKTLWKVPPKSEPCIDVSFFAQNMETQNVSMLAEEGAETASLEKEINTKHTVISATEPVTENKSVTETHKKMDQKGKKQTKTKRNKKTPLLWKSFPQSDACIDLTFFTKNSDIDDGPLPEKENYQEAFSSSGKKTLWKVLPKSEPCIDISFFAENIETKNVSMPAEGHDEIVSLNKKNYSENTVIFTTQLITTEESILKQKETLDQKGQKHPSLGKPMDNIQTGNLTEVPVDKTEEKIQGEGLTEIQNLPHSPENTSQAKRMCEVKCKESELEHMEVQKYLMQQLNDMFDVNQKLNAKLQQQKDLTRKLLSERRQRKKTMVSVQTQSESQDTSPVYQCASVQTEMDVPETKCNLKPVRKTISMQTEMDVLETRFHLEPVYKTISTQTELFLLLRKQPTETKKNGHQDWQKKVSKSSTDENRRESATRDASELQAVGNENISGDNIEKELSVPEMVGDQAETIKNEINTNETAIGEVLQVIEEETVSITQQYGDHQDEKKRSKKSKRKIKRKAAARDASELESLCNENISGENIEKELSVPEMVGDQAETIENDIQMNEIAIGEVLQVIEEETVSTAQQNGDRKDEKKRSTKSKRKIKRKAAARDASEQKAVNEENISGENIEKELSVPEMVGDQAETIENDIHTNETDIGEVLHVIEEETVSTAQQNGDPEDEIKRSKKSKRKIKRKAAARDASEQKAVNEENISGENIEKELSVPEMVGDQAETIENDIHTNETAIGEVLQVIEEETVSTAQQNGDPEDEIKRSKKSKRKIKRKAATRDASELESLCNENISGENIEKELSVPEMVGDQAETIENDIHMNETAISEVLQVIEEETVSITQQYGDPKDEIKRSKKSKRKIKKKATTRDASELKAVNEENISGENIEKELSVPETGGDQAETIKNKINTIETAIGEVLQVIEEETVSITQQYGDPKDEIKRSKKSKRKIKKKAATRDASELKAVNEENISGENIEKELSVPEMVGDQAETIENDIHTNETAIGEVLQVIEEVTVSTAQQNGDPEDEIKRSKKSKRKIKKKAATRDASELKAVNEENISGENIEKELSVPEMVGDQAETIENEINTNETVIGEVLQVIEEETVSTAQQNGDHQDEKKRSKKSKRKIKTKAATRDASELESLCKENVSGANIEQEVSTVETIQDQTVFVKNEIHTIETEIAKEQQMTEEKPELETVVDPIETDQHLVSMTMTTNPDSEKIPEIPLIAPEQTETILHVVSTEEECGLMENQKTSPPQIKVTLNKDEVQTLPQELELQAESAEENNISEEEENPQKKTSLWKRIKKALTPPLLRRFKNRCKVHPA